MSPSRSCSFLCRHLTIIHYAFAPTIAASRSHDSGKCGDKFLASIKMNVTHHKNDTVLYSNGTHRANNTDTIRGPEIRWVVGYFVLLACGCVLNLVHLLALIRSRRSGILSLILQMCLVDVTSIYVALSEILTLTHSTWYFAPEVCQLFQGSEVLINTLTVYLIICFNFHAISLWNLHELEVKKNAKNPLTSCNTDRDDSNYRKRKDDISTVFPTIFIWTVSLSLSIPNFTLSSTLKLKENVILCAVIDTFYGKMLQHSLLLFRIILPSVLLFFSLILLTIKLNQTSTTDIENVLTKKMGEIRKFLIFGIIMTLFYLLTSFQRQFFHFAHIVSHSFETRSLNNFKMPPLYNHYLSESNITYLAMLHYTGGAFRSLLCLCVLPKFNHLVRSKVFVCCKVKE